MEIIRITIEATFILLIIISQGLISKRNLYILDIFQSKQTIKLLSYSGVLIFSLKKD